MDETSILKEIKDDIHKTGTLAETNKQRLTETFGKRYTQAMELVNDHKVTRYMFNPSGRKIWVVQGKHGEHQVLPESMFCTCDDYFFRVMGGKKQVCYHIIAQQLAEATGNYRTNDLADQDYSQITSKWTPRPVQT